MIKNFLLDLSLVSGKLGGIEMENNEETIPSPFFSMVADTQMTKFRPRKPVFCYLTQPTEAIVVV